MSDPYTSHSAGKLKLKGVKDGKVSKNKKKKDKPTSATKDVLPGAEVEIDTSVVLKHLAAEDAAMTAEHETTKVHTNDTVKMAAAHAVHEHDEDAAVEIRKTEAERRWEEQRRKRLEERLKREGVKSHKERVQELNKYLSGLSEHHDMPKIGPG